MPTSSAMITTMFGFLASVCADATPPNAREHATIAVVRKPHLIIDVSSICETRKPINARESSLAPQETGQRKGDQCGRRNLRWTLLCLLCWPGSCEVRREI